MTVLRVSCVMAAFALAVPAAAHADTDGSCCWVTYIGTAAPDYATGHEGDSHLEGRGGNDRLWGALGNDTLIGNKGNDILDGGPGFDFCRGGLNADTFISCEVIEPN